MFCQICIQQHSSTILLVAVNFQFIFLGFLRRHNDNSVSSSCFASGGSALARFSQGCWKIVVITGLFVLLSLLSSLLSLMVAVGLRRISSLTSRKYLYILILLQLFWENKEQLKNLSCALCLHQLSLILPIDLINRFLNNKPQKWLSWVSYVFKNILVNLIH